MTSLTYRLSIDGAWQDSEGDKSLAAVTGAYGGAGQARGRRGVPGVLGRAAIPVRC
jgi:hypothetical protein